MTTVTVDSHSQKFIDEVEVGARLSVSEKTLRNWRLFGRGPKYKKFGKCVRYGVADLEAWIASLPAGGAGTPAALVKNNR